MPPSPPASRSGGGRSSAPSTTSKRSVCESPHDCEPGGGIDNSRELSLSGLLRQDLRTDLHALRQCVQEMRRFVLVHMHETYRSTIQEAIAQSQAAAEGRFSPHCRTHAQVAIPLIPKKR